MTNNVENLKFIHKYVTVKRITEPYEEKVKT